MGQPALPASRLLVVNADDFGLTAGVNAGIIGAFRRGLVRSASLMVTTPGFEDAVKELCDAFRAKKLPDSMQDDQYFNVRRLKRLLAGGKGEREGEE